MATYRLTVEANEPNADYQAQAEAAQQQGALRMYTKHYDNVAGELSRTTTRTVLSVELTEAQWRAVRDAAVGGWE